MVFLHVKHNDDSQFLFETTVNESVSVLVRNLVGIFNGRLKIQRLCAEIEELAKHGIFLPENMQGLLEEQIKELHLVDENEEMHSPSGGFVNKKDPLSRRNGKAPNDKMVEVLTKTVSEAKAKISKEQVKAYVCLTQKSIKEAIDILRGAVTIVYPMGLPEYDPIHLELNNLECLEGTAAGKEVIEESLAVLWFAGKEMQRDKMLKDYIGTNEKSKVIVKLQKRGSGAPAREPLWTEEEYKKLMMQNYRKQEEMKKLEDVDDDSYLDSKWADSKQLRQDLSGLKDVSWKPVKFDT